MTASAATPASAAHDDDYEAGPHPSYCLVDLVVHRDDRVDYAFRRNGVRFHVVVRGRDLAGPGRLRADFDAFRAGLLGDPEVAFEFEQWVLSCLEGFMRVAAPLERSRRGATLLEYYTAPAHALHLVNVDGRLRAVREKYVPAVHGGQGPRTAISDSPPDGCDAELRAPSSSSTILRSTLPRVPRFLASQLERAPDGPDGIDPSSPPRKVRLRRCRHHFSPCPGTAPEPNPCSFFFFFFFFFKAGVADRGHVREMALLDRIASLRELDEPYRRTSRLAGLVVWDDDTDSLMGLLMEYIAGQTLTAALTGGRADAEGSLLPPLGARRKWFAQMATTVARLHEAGIVWGDVKPDNVMITEQGNAVLVDFGGGYTPRYIPRSMHETVEGDLMGLERIRLEMRLWSE